MSPASECTYQISRFANKTNTLAKSEEMSWSGLSRLLTQHIERDAKDGPGWSAASYGSVRHRANENVSAVCCYVADLDHGLNLGRLEDQIREYAHIVYSTFSHTPEEPRIRVVIPLQEPIVSAQWRDAWERVNVHAFGGSVDPACKDPSRFYYLPSCPPERLMQRIAYAIEGNRLNPFDFPPVERQVLPRIQHEKDEINLRPGDDFNSRGDIRALLRQAGGTFLYEKGGRGYWRRPGKREGISAVDGLGEDGELAYVFTSNWPPFEAQRAYTPFEAFARLNHGNDFAAAARDLSAQGYGGQYPKKAWCPEGMA